MGKTRVGVCGYGPMGRMHAQLLKSRADVELVGIGDPQADLRERAASELGVPTFPTGEALIDSRTAEVMVVCAPTYLHSSLTVRALEAGCHVLCEKPMARTVEECDLMIGAARRTGRFLTIGQVLRFWPEYLWLKEALGTGRYGRLRTLTMQRIGNVTRGYKDWFLDESLGGTQIFDRHIHDTDLVLWLLGAPRGVETWAREEKEGGIVHCYTRYDYPEITAVAEGSADLAPQFPFTMAFLAVFEKATADYNSRRSPTLTVYREDGQTEIPDLTVSKSNEKAGLNITSSSGYAGEEEYFLECVLKGRKPETVTPESARETVLWVHREMESARARSLRRP
jgi:predicted dehydrogenase